MYINVFSSEPNSYQVSTTFYLCVLYINYHERKKKNKRVSAPGFVSLDPMYVCVCMVFFSFVFIASQSTLIVVCFLVV